MTEKILFVDDDPNVLASFQRQLRKEFAVETALGPREGFEAIKRQSGGYAVIVSDLRMPEMDGIQFLSRVRDITPDTVRMMLTGNADLHAAIEAVNEGNIFRFLTKPCPMDILGKALVAGLKQHRLITAERELLEKTLRGSIKVLCEVLALLNPEAFGRATRITRYVKEIAARMDAPNLWELETAATLSQIGCIILPEETLEKIYHGWELTTKESQLFNMHPSIASGLLTNIPRMKRIAEIIEYQEKHYDGAGIPQEPRRGEDIPLGSRILKAVLDLDTLESRHESKGKALRELKKRLGWYDPEVLAAFDAVLGIEARYEIKSMRTNQLMDGMILAQDVVTPGGRLLLPKGYEVNRTLRERLRNYGESLGIEDSISVYVPFEA
jgi:response regulator RpfG family c-di-GMP phosphodiesterase